VETVPEERNVNRVFKDIQKGERNDGKPRKRWLDDVENDPKKVGVWRLEKNSWAWRGLKMILKEIRFLLGPYSLWRRRKSVSYRTDSLVCGSFSGCHLRKFINSA
jgi:hypothetical protein